MIYTKPSFYALALTGFFYLFIILAAYKNWSQLKNLSGYKIIKLLSLVGILIGVHGLLHLGLENVYNYNPLE